jgi:hypothetical protein
MAYQRHERDNASWAVAEVPRDRTHMIMALFVITLVIIVVAIGVVAWRHGETVYAEFMSGCEQDHKHYECMLLWRASKRDDPLVVPTPVYVPNAR